MKWVLLICIGLTAATQHYSWVTAQSISRTSAPTLPLSIDSIRKTFFALAADSMEGRGTGHLGGNKSATYLAKRMRALGLAPAGAGQSYFQPIPMHGAIPLDGSQLSFRTRGEEMDLRLWDEYLLFNTGIQTALLTPGRMVFVGYGIVAPEFDYNDYQDLEVEGKIVVYFSGEPQSLDLKFFEGPKRTMYSSPVYKHRTAIARGARGTIMIPLPREQKYTNWEYWTKVYRTEDVRLVYGIAESFNVMLRPEAAEKVFAGEPFSLRDLLRREEQGRIRSFEMSATVRFKGKFKERDFVAPNVVGIIEGSDPLMKNSYLLVSAHYDGLGIGESVQGDSIYNSALDNALGVAGAVELMRIFSEPAFRPRRSLIFLLLTGEEKGLLGSHYYCEHPLVPLSKTIATVNIDGIAITGEFESIAGIGAEFSTLDEMLKTVASSLNLDISHIDPASLLHDPFEASDQFAFANAGIPSVLIMEGLKFKHLDDDEGKRRFIEWGNTVYHTPFDEPHAEIDYNAVRQHLELIGLFVHHLANTFIEPQWKKNAPFVNARLRSIAEEL